MMLRFVLSVLLLALAAPAAQAQLVRAYGVRAGLNRSTVETGLATPYQSRTGLQLAAFAEGLATPVFSVVGELEYARRGYADTQQERGPNNEFIGDVRATTALDYLAVPVLARLRLPGDRAVVPYAVAGPRAELLVRRVPGRYAFSAGTLEDEMSEAFPRFGLSGVIGLGAGLRGLLGQEMRVEARYGFGLTDLLPDSSARELRHSGVDFCLGVAL